MDDNRMWEAIIKAAATPGIHGRWKKGQSGNPKGRPSQAPFKAAMERLRAGEPKFSPEAIRARGGKSIRKFG